MSLFQDYSGDVVKKGTRTPTQQVLFERCLRSMHLIFGNQHIQTWFLTATPPTTERNFADRGWCQFELRTAAVTTPAHMLLDLGQLTEDFEEYHEDYWFDPRNDSTLAKSCSAAHLLPPEPATPAHFDAAILPCLNFSDENDRDVVSHLYHLHVGR